MSAGEGSYRLSESGDAFCGRNSGRMDLHLVIVELVVINLAKLRQVSVAEKTTLPLPFVASRLNYQSAKLSGFVNSERQFEHSILNSSRHCGLIQQSRHSIFVLPRPQTPRWPRYRIGDRLNPSFPGTTAIQH